jgi:hypothetical protein
VSLYGAFRRGGKECAEKFAGRFSMGYEAMREQTLAQQKKIHLGGNDG